MTHARIADFRCETGEGPRWHPDEGVLYWTDIPRGRLYRYDPRTDEAEEVYRTKKLGGFTVERDGALLLFLQHGTVRRWTPEGETREVIDELPDETESRYNDVIADPEGRVFCGTMPTGDRLGSLYRLDTDGSICRVVPDLDIPNGMGFSPDGDTFYLTESEARSIYAYDYDRTTGEIVNRRTFVETPADDGVPDGMAVDEDGFVWSARWNGGRVVRYTPDGAIDAEYSLPARKVSAVTFGGPDRETLYATTAGGPDRETEGDGAGATFRLDVEESVRGRPEFRSDVAGAE